MKKAWVVILLGSPGSGKGTQARNLSSTLHIPQISTGEILRAAVDGQTALGRRVEAHMRLGHLVPDDIIFEVVRKRLNQSDCGSGVIFDGFPRTLEQARFVDDFLGRRHSSEMVVFHICIDKDLLIKRILGRRVCSTCGNSYNIYLQHLLDEGHCDKDGGALIHRADDNEGTILQRARAYAEQTQPLIGHYAARDILYRIDGNLEPETVSAQIYHVLGKLRQGSVLETGGSSRRTSPLGESQTSSRLE